MVIEDTGSLKNVSFNLAPWCLPGLEVGYFHCNFSPRSCLLVFTGLIYHIRNQEFEIAYNFSGELLNFLALLILFVGEKWIIR